MPAGLPSRRQSKKAYETLSTVRLVGKTEELISTSTFKVESANQRQHRHPKACFKCKSLGSTWPSESKYFCMILTHAKVWSILVWKVWKEFQERHWGKMRLCGDRSNPTLGWRVDNKKWNKGEEGIEREPKTWAVAEAAFGWTTPVLRTQTQLSSVRGSFTFRYLRAFV